jgi:hypothetical protein
MYDDSISMYFQYLDGGAIEDKFATSNNIDDALVKAGTTTGSQRGIRRTDGAEQIVEFPGGRIEP